ncbi:hypothetical protein J2128_001916 [Methanomicrobium sp. W14]|uniref:hypothetical protein n=1 Tax=Methanomicrobium sp. W14 TaxID=2817839 RepID=UPI001AE88680|nr:hypothetical protein [Methanomicrobium sp. W14]MBP2133950.1 hypothetical protein [Methanomicrobium sp. W14]
MKKFNSKKLGIFLGVMLLAGAMVVGPASADLSASGHIDQYKNHISYDGRGDSNNGHSSITVTLTLTRDGSFVNEVTGYNPSSPIPAHYAKASGKYYNYPSGTYRNVIETTATGPKESDSAVYVLRVR